MEQVIVDCCRAGELIASYSFGLPEAMLPGLAPDRDSLIEQAKSELTSERKAFPPYEGITFSVRWPK